MRLINNELMTLEWYMGTGGSDVPDYAILSHTWDEDEVTYQDFMHQEKTILRGKKGFGKIEMACRLSSQAGLQHTWVDTCCIDKTSSSELTEAINSMFQWYRQARVCLVWLADLASSAEKEEVEVEDEFGMEASQLAACRWVTRGWTLQELIAPSAVDFYDAEWAFRGTKADLSGVLSGVTGVSADVLRDSSRLLDFSVAQRMSWAAGRTTTRLEDMAYCLLGIFDVNMPMLYGEGTRAFIRLQEEIARDCNDLSLFAWAAEPGGQAHRGILAESPAEFRGAGDVVNIDEIALNPEFVITNKGLRIASELHHGNDGAYLMMLRCARPASSSSTGDNASQSCPLGIWLQHQGGGVYGRIKADQLGTTAAATPGRAASSVSGTSGKALYIAKRISPEMSAKIAGSSTSNAFMLRRNFNEAFLEARYPEFPFSSYAMGPTEQWDSLRRMFLTHGSSSFTAFVQFSMRPDEMNFNAAASDEPQDRQRIHNGNAFLLAFGRRRGPGARPWVTLATPREGGEVFASIGNLNKLEQLCSGAAERRSVLLQNSMMEDCQALMVSVEEQTIDGKTVFCLDLDMQPI